MRFVLRFTVLLRTLAQMLLPPQAIVLDSVFGMAKTRLLGVAVRLGIAEALENRGPQTAEELSRGRSAKPELLHRALRALVSQGFFRLDSRGKFRNNRASRALIPGRPGSIASFVSYFDSRATSRAWEELASTLETGKNAFERVHGDGVWEYFGKNPEEERLFGSAMRELTEMDACAIAGGYPFSRFARICDVAGGSGTLISRIQASHPRLEAAVFDSARSFGSEPAHKIQRITGNFFEAVPSGFDAYLMKDILHDWDDGTARRILRTCRASMEPGTTLLVIEMLLESGSDDLAANLCDIQMMVVCGDGKQRSRAEVRSLLAETGFEPGRIINLASPYSIVEGIAR
jgi:hypothetical protein